MGRTKGSRNHDFEDERSALLGRLVAHLVSVPRSSSALSFREIARLLEVSPSALRHYFPDREDALVAAFEAAHHGARREIDAAAGGGKGVRLPPLEKSLKDYLEHFVSGFEVGVGNLIAFGLSAGLTDDRIGPGFINHVLEPSLQALERRLEQHLLRGDLPSCEVRLAALSLLGPVLLALLHQGPLGGDRCRPLDVKGVIAEQVRRFVRAYGP